MDVTDKNPKQQGIEAGYHNPLGSIPRGCPYALRTDERRDWLDGWQLGLRLRERHREELLGMIETPDSVMKRFNERFK